MRDLYLNKIVDLTDPQCEFISEFNREIKKYGAIVYNYESNSYQFIRNFQHIDCKKEILPDFMRVEPLMTSGPTTGTMAISAASGRGVPGFVATATVTAPRDFAHFTALTTDGAWPEADVEVLPLRACRGFKSHSASPRKTPTHTVRKSSRSFAKPLLIRS